MRALQVFVLLVAVTAAASASPSNPTNAERERARQLFEKSKPLQDARKCVKAAKLLKEAFALHESPDIAANLGGCEASMGKYAAAAEHLQFAHTKMMPSAKPEKREKIKTALELVKKQVAELALDLDPVDASVSVNGMATRVRDGLVFVPPGKHVLRVGAPGRIAKTIVLEVEKQQRLAKTIVLDREAGGVGPVAGAGGSGAVTGQAGDDRPGQGGGGGGQIKSDGMTARTGVAIVGGALTIVTVGAGVFFAVRASSAQDDVDTLKSRATAQLGGNCPSGSGAPVCVDLADSADQRNTANKNATIAFVAGSVLGAATVATYLLWPTSEKQTGRAATRVVPVVSGSRLGLGLQGSFF